MHTCMYDSTATCRLAMATQAQLPLPSACHDSRNSCMVAVTDGPCEHNSSTLWLYCTAMDNRPT